MLQGPDIGRQIELTDDPLEIGRGEEAGLQIDSDLVSRRHATLIKVGKRFLIRDNGSTNGTYVGSEKITTAELREGDLIKIGKVVLRYTESSIEVQYHEQILERTRVDPLTGAYNKGYFDEAVARLILEGVRGGRLLGLIVFDVDHFKKINDVYGHPAGDAVLIEMVEVARKSLGERATLCRVGGEEFAVILPGSTAAEARDSAERLRAAVEATRFAFDGKVVPVTISLGAGACDGTEDFTTFYKRVDSRLYEAKRTGRNRVV